MSVRGLSFVDAPLPATVARAVIAKVKAATVASAPLPTALAIDTDRSDRSLATASIAPVPTTGARFRKEMQSAVTFLP